MSEIFSNICGKDHFPGRLIKVTDLISHKWRIVGARVPLLTPWSEYGKVGSFFMYKSWQFLNEDVNLVLVLPKNKV